MKMLIAVSEKKNAFRDFSRFYLPILNKENPFLLENFLKEKRDQHFC